MSRIYKFKCSAVPPELLSEFLEAMDHSLEVSRRTFRKHVCHSSLAMLESELGYARHYKQGLTLAGDWAVSYGRSKMFGKWIYFIKWSGIEFVFMEEE